MPNPAEVAQLIVEGQIYEDWESVWVQQRWADGWPLFRFTATERLPLAKQWGLLQFKPGDLCEVMLGNVLAITGIVLTRQTSYDAVNHTVELSGAGKTWAANTSSIDQKIANFDGMTLPAIADKIGASVDMAFVKIGKLDMTPFDKLQAQPGELVFDFMDKLARTRGTVLGTDQYGGMLLIGQHSFPVVQDLTEGDNIKKMQCIISNEMISTKYSVLGQAPNASEMSAAQAANMEAQVPGSLKNFKKLIQTVAEQPLKTMQELQSRAYYEARFREGTLIRAFVTVQGWFRDQYNLWKPGDNVWVNAPMAMLNGMALKIQTATFSQDNQSGTQTVLELVLPWMLSDQPFSTDGGPADAIPPPDPAVTTSNVPADVTQTQPM